MPLDPQARAFLDKLQRAGAPRMHDLSPEDARALVMPLQMPRESMGRIGNRVIPGPAGAIPIRIYHPQRAPADGGGDPPPVVVFFHGGGWVVGSISSHDALCRRLCNRSGCIVVSVEYRLAPEHKYPAAVEDAYAAAAWVSANAGEIDGDPTRIAVAGDSAGGNLAAAVCLKAQELRGPQIAAQVLIYPITDYLPDFDSYHRNGRDYFLTTESIAWFWEHYLENTEQGGEATASPLRAADLSGQPPAVVMVAEFDPLIDEGLAYADRLEQSGVRVERIVADGQIHGCLRRLDLFDRASSVCDELCAALRRVLQPGFSPADSNCRI